MENSIKISELINNFIETMHDFGLCQLNMSDIMINRQEYATYII